MSETLGERVRPAIGLIESLGFPLPLISVELHAVHIPLVEKAQRVPNRVAVIQAERIRKLSRRIGLNLSRLSRSKHLTPGAAYWRTRTARW